MQSPRLPRIDVNDVFRPKGHWLFVYSVRIVIILAGCLIGAVAVNSFLAPARILPGGVTGIAQLLYYFLHVPIGAVYFLLNIPLFVLGYRFLGKRFVLLTGIAVVAFSAFTDLVHLGFHLPTTDPLLISLYGGVLLGISSGLIIRVGGSSGGTDILSLAINRVTGRSVGGVSFGINLLIVLASMSVFGIQAGLYSLVSMFATSRVINTMMNFQNRKTALIVSPRAPEIARAIGTRLGRGSTLIQASGTYTNAATGVLMCSLTHFELSELRAICTEIDPHVFISVLETTEIVGHFRRLPD